VENGDECVCPSIQCAGRSGFGYSLSMTIILCTILIFMVTVTID